MKQVYLFIFLLFSGNLILAQNDLSNLKKGIYPTYADFYNNTPILPDSIIIDSNERGHRNWEGTYDFKLNSYDNKRIMHVWGFSDGENAFVFYQEEAWKLSFRDNIYRFTGYGLPKPRYKKTSIVFINPGGISSGGGVDDVIYYFDERKQIKTPTSYTLDMDNGRVKHKNYGFVDGTGFKKCKIHLYRSAKDEILDSIYIKVGNLMPYTMIPNTYHNPILDVVPTLTEICLLDENHCFKINLTSKDEWYFKVSNQGGEKKIVEVSSSEGSFHAFKAEKKHKKRLKKEKKMND